MFNSIGLVTTTRLAAREKKRLIMGYMPEQQNEGNQDEHDSIYQTDQKTGYAARGKLIFQPSDVKTGVSVR